MASLLILTDDERSFSLKGTLSMTCGYNVGGNSDEPSTPPKLIPANDARPLRDDFPVFISELSWGIKVVDDVYWFGWISANNTPITAAIIDDLIMNCISL